MKLITVLLVALSLWAWGQGIDLGASGSSVSINNGNTLAVPNSVLFTDTGTISLQLGPIESGDFQNGATFQQGGSFVVTTGAGTIFNGTVDANSTWIKTKKANGTYFYTMNGFVTDSTTGQTGAFVLVSQPVGSPGQLYPGSATVNVIDVHLN